MNLAAESMPESVTPRVNAAQAVDHSRHAPAKMATICQVLHSLDVGGAEVLANRIARQLSPSFRFVFACLDHLGPLGEELRSRGFTVEVLGRKPGLDRRCMKRLLRFVRAERVDVIHTHQYTPFFYALAAGVWRRRPPILFTEHGRWFPDYPRRKRMLFNRLFIRSNDRIVAVGNSVKTALIDNEGIGENRIQVIYNGIEIDRYSGLSKHRAAVRGGLNLADDDFVIIQVARLDALKDHLTAVRTMEHVVRALPRAKLLIVGAGPEEAKIRAEVQRLGLDHQIRFLGLRHDVPRLLAAADVFLLTSISEGIPLTLIEAMAAGLPVVSTNVGGVPEVVEESVTGYLAPAADDRALADCVRKIAATQKQSGGLAAAAKRRATDLFSERQMIDGYHRLYDRMLIS